MYKHFFKRVIDFIISLMALFVIWPILLVIYIWLTIANKSAGAIFYQERPGKDEKIFRAMKFKSMKSVLLRESVEFAGVEALNVC